MDSSSPIGVFDSGVGGLSILEKIHQFIPNENLIYLADSAYAPYGQKGEAYIQERCLVILNFFHQQNVKAVVVACNTATAAAVTQLRAKHTLPIIGMEPAIKPAAQQSKSGVIGVMATAGTIDSDKFINLTSEFSDKLEIITKACPGLVEQIELLSPDYAKIKALLKMFLTPLQERGVDTLVLGCTHYSLIIELIREAVGEDINIIDTNFAVAKELKRRLQENGLENTQKQNTSIKFYSSGNLEEQSQLISRYWGETVKVNALS